MPIYTENKKAYFNYEILETYEAGIELFGFEVKAVKTGLSHINSSFCIIRGGEAYILGMHIPPYQKKNVSEGYDQNRTRKLLLSKKEVKKIKDKDDTKGLTLVPISVYSKGPYIKVSIAIARGKKEFNKKEKIKSRDLDREMEREYKVR
jgi:SsrA-binding protein